MNWTDWSVHTILSAIWPSSSSRRTCSTGNGSADTILTLHKNIRVVARRSGHYDGEFRLLPLGSSAGRSGGDLHQENGVRLLLNPEKVYYSVRSGNERKRVAALVSDGRESWSFFSGIGPYPLVIGRIAPVPGCWYRKKPRSPRLCCQKSLV